MDNSSTPLPRVTIQFCTQCKWMLRAAYFAQELLSTFSTSLGEVALQPSTGGTFVVHLYHTSPSPEDGRVTIQKVLLWDRKAEGGFPETKELKKRVRNIIDPTRDLGHVDGKKSSASNPDPNPSLTHPDIPTDDTVSATPPVPTSPPQQPSNELETAPEGRDRAGTKDATPMDGDADSNGAGAVGEGQEEEEEEVVGANGKIRIVAGDGEGFGFCRPGDEDCG